MGTAELGPITTGGDVAKEDLTTSSRSDSCPVVMGPRFRGDDSEGEVKAHILFIDTETFGPFLMVW